MGKGVGSPAVKIYNINWSYQLLEGHTNDGGAGGLADWRAGGESGERRPAQEVTQVLVLSWLVAMGGKTLARR